MIGLHHHPEAIAIASVSDVCPMLVPLIIILSTVKVVKVPNDVILDCAAVVTVAAVPDTFPVTSPVSGPAKASEVTVPSKNASLNSKAVKTYLNLHRCLLQELKHHQLI